MFTSTALIHPHQARATGPANAATPACENTANVAANGWGQRYGYGYRKIAARVNDVAAITEPASFSVSALVLELKGL